MKRLVEALVYVLTIITSIIVICTFLTTYQFHYVGQMFNSYVPLQFGVSATMAALGLRFILDKSIEKRMLYSGISFVISLSLLYFEDDQPYQLIGNLFLCP